jgi:C-terminal processing protease CtpA/Prc
MKNCIATASVSIRHCWTSQQWHSLMSLLLLAIVSAFAAAEEPQGKAKWPYKEDLKALIAEIDRVYPFFELKDIRADWEKTKEQVLKDAEDCKTDAAFVALLLRLQRMLRDAHLGPRDMKIPLTGPPPSYYPGICFMPANEERVIVMAARPGLDADLKPGTVVTRIDGQDARKFLEARTAAAWDKGGFFSSRQRARMFEYRIPLQGEKGETHRIAILAGKEEKELKLVCDQQATGWPHTYNMPEKLARAGRSCLHGELPGGFGYIYLRRIDESVAEGIAQAAAAHPDAKGWIVDLRGNGGGGYDETLLSKLKLLRRPVAGLIDAGCISAGETFARDLVRYCDAKLFGATTAGSSSSKQTWQFPSGIGAMVIPVRSRWGADGRAIEYYGIDPHVAVEAVPEEAQQGKNSCILRALEYLAKETKGD